MKTRYARVVFKDPDLGQEKQALACLICLRSRFLEFFSFLRVFINYFEGRTKWSEDPHPCSTMKCLHDVMFIKVFIFLLQPVSFHPLSETRAQSALIG